MIKERSTYHRLVSYLLVAEVFCWVLTVSGYFILDALEVSYLHPECFYLLLILPVFAWLTWFQWKKKNQIYQQYTGFGDTRMLWVRFEPVKAFLHYLLLRLTLFFLIVAMAQPASGSHKVSASKRVLDLVICLDISNSMNAKDMGGAQVSRLAAAKNAIGELLNQVKGERIAVIVFANDAYTQLPLTMDYGAAKLFVPDIETSMISDQGTNIGKALEQAQLQFKDSESGKAILVITDGEDHEALWKTQVELLGKQQVELAYLGLGSSKGALIPNDPYDPSRGYKRENDQPVVSKLDSKALQSMASASGSKLVVSDSEFPTMVELVSDFKNTKHKQSVQVTFQVAYNYFFIPCIMALICMLMYFFLPYFTNSEIK